jgi:hypothetical protein
MHAFLEAKIKDTIFFLEFKLIIVVHTEPKNISFILGVGAM